MLAYGMAPASVVAPVGSVGVLVNQFIAVVFLGEALRLRDLAGLAGVVTGVVLIILAVPESGDVLSANRLLSDAFY